MELYEKFTRSSKKYAKSDRYSKKAFNLTRIKKWNQKLTKYFKERSRKKTNYHTINIMALV